ncbi:MAG TPA: hypothetical protein VGC36_10065, partial [Rhizomicrobium sp.]
TATRTRSRTPTVTGTLFVPTGPLGERVFSIAPGTLLASPPDTGSGLFTSGLSGANAAISFSPGPLVLVGGVPDGAGVAPLSLRDDAFVDVSVVDGSRLCLKLVAAGSTGSIDCNGGSRYGVIASQPAGADLTTTWQIGVGPQLGPGNAMLLVQQFAQPLPSSVTTPCENVAYGLPAGTVAYTTGEAQAAKGSLGLAVSGEAFPCALWQQSDTAGRLAWPAPSMQSPIGDVANVFRFAD